MNAWTDAAMAYLSKQYDQFIRGKAGGLRPGEVWIKNTTAALVPLHGILGLDGPLFEPGSDGIEKTFDRTLAFAGVAPTLADHATAYVIALEPVPAGAVRRALLFGATSCTLTINHADHQYAVIDPGGDYLETAGTGTARVLWKEAGTGAEKRAVVLLGAVPAGVVTFGVKVFKTGGSAGSATTQCTFVYTVKDESGVVLGTGMTPAKLRPAAGPFAAPPDGSWGLAFRAADNTLVLWDPNEVPAVEVCDP